MILQVFQDKSIENLSRRSENPPKRFEGFRYVDSYKRPLQRQEEEGHGSGPAQVQNGFPAPVTGVTQPEAEWIDARQGATYIE